MSGRMVMMYGGPSPDPTSPRQPLQPFAPVVPNTTSLDLLQAQQPKRVRVCVMVGDDGTVKLKVLCDDKLIAEVEGSRSLTLETLIGGAP